MGVFLVINPEKCTPFYWENQLAMHLACHMFDWVF